jgi:hypothetical protein
VISPNQDPATFDIHSFNTPRLTQLLLCRVIAHDLANATAALAHLGDCVSSGLYISVISATHLLRFNGIIGPINTSQCLRVPSKFVVTSIGVYDSCTVI